MSQHTFHNNGNFPADLSVASAAWLRAQDRVAESVCMAPKTRKAVMDASGLLNDIMEQLCASFEQHAPDWASSVLFRDHECAHWRHASGAYLHEPLTQSMRSCLVDVVADDCERAATEPDAWQVRDVTEDHRWRAVRRSMEAQALCGSVVTPIRAPEGDVLGLFAGYPRTAPYDVAPMRDQLVSYAHIAGMVIQQHQLEHALHANACRLLRLREPHRVVRWSADYASQSLTSMGANARTLFGHEWVQPKGERWDAFIHPDDRLHVHDRCLRARGMSYPCEVQYRMATAKRETVWIQDLVYVDVNQDGRPVQFRGAMLDVSSVMEAAKWRHQGMHALQETLEDTSVIASIRDAEGRYLFVNRQWESQFSRSRIHVLGQRIRDVFPPPIADEVRKHDQQVLETLAPRECEQIVPGEKELQAQRVIKFALPPCPDAGATVCEVGIERRSQKRVQHLVYAQNHMLHLLACGESLDTICEQLCVFVEQQLPGSLCAVITEADGRAPREVKAAPSVPESFVHALNSLMVVGHAPPVASAVFGGPLLISDVRAESCYPELCRLLTEQALRAWWSVPLYGKDQAQLGALCLAHSHPCVPTSHDYEVLSVATQLARIACERHHSEEVLAERERKLRQAQKIEAVGLLAGGIAHDFNNILTAIMGFNELAKMVLANKSPAAKYLEEVHMAGLRGKGLTKQILAFCHEKDHEKSLIELDQVVKEAVHFLELTLPSTIEIRLSIDVGVGAIYADPVQMHQILMNLCTNAAQAMGANGGLLDVSLAQCELTAVAIVQHNLNSGAKPGSYVKLVVRDTGPGISSSIIDRVFDPFYTTKGPEEGAGLGLSVVQGIVDSHDGVVDVQSTVGQGTTFTVLLPRSVPASAPNVLKKASLRFGQGEHVLFVDDDESVAAVAKELLTRLGYVATVKTSSREALHVFRNTPEDFDVVMTDHVMPHMTGAALSQELRRIRSDIPIIICTGYEESAALEHAHTLGVRACMRKPLLVDDLSETLRTVLES